MELLHFKQRVQETLLETYYVQGTVEVVTFRFKNYYYFSSKLFNLKLVNTAALGGHKIKAKVKGDSLQIEQK